MTNCSLLPIEDRKSLTNSPTMWETKMRRTKPDIKLMTDHLAAAHKIAVEGGMQLMEYFIAMALEEAKVLLKEQKSEGEK